MSLIGTWALIKYESRYEDGSVRLPMGESPEGVLIYTDDGFVSVQMTCPDRIHFASGDWLAGTPDEIKSAFESYLAYYGRYALNSDDSIVTHHVENCTFPNWNGASLVRWYVLDDGDVLTLKTPSILMGGGMRRGYLVWKRKI